MLIYPLAATKCASCLISVALAPYRSLAEQSAMVRAQHIHIGSIDMRCERNAGVNSFPIRCKHIWYAFGSIQILANGKWPDREFTDCTRHAASENTCRPKISDERIGNGALKHFPFFVSVSKWFKVYRWKGFLLFVFNQPSKCIHVRDFYARVTSRIVPIGVCMRASVCICATQ